MNYAQDTSVSVDNTRRELESVLTKSGAEAFGYITDGDRACIQFKVHGKFVRFNLPLPSRKDRKFTHYMRGRNTHERSPESSAKEWEQACRAAWRALFLCVKAKLVAVSAGITTFEEEFLAHIVVPGGGTVGDQLIPKLEAAYLSGRPMDFMLALNDRNP